MAPRPVPCGKCRHRREKVVGDRTYHVCDWWEKHRDQLPVAGLWFIPSEMARAANDAQVNGPNEGEVRECAQFSQI